MRICSTTACLILAATCVGASLPACVDALPPGTTAASPLTGPTPDVAQVTFVRPVSSCDTGEYLVVVDEVGHLLAKMSPGTQVAATVSPGRHVVYAWSAVDVHLDSEPGFNPVGAVRVNAHRGETKYVAVEIDSPCRFNRVTFDLHVMGEKSPRWSEMKEWLDKTSPVTVDLVAGQADLASRPAHLQRHLEFGARTLHRRDQNRLRDQRTAALRREDETETGFETASSDMDIGEAE